MFGREFIASLLVAFSGGGIGKLLCRKRRLLEDIRAIELLPSLNVPFIPWTNAAARPLTVVYMLNEICINGRRNVLELGSGISTLYLASALGRCGGRLVSVEHDEAWIGIIEGYLGKLGIPEGVVRFCHAPMKDFETDEFGTLPWYDSGKVKTAVPEELFDMMVVDGPEAWMKGARFARYPALPVLAGNLAGDSVVFLDDVDRKGERRILGKWARENAFKAMIRPECCLGILRRGNSRVYNIF